ncbi:MAG: hypothetical protein ACI4XP_01630 [Acutalibacteraceae bacterium]
MGYHVDFFDDRPSTSSWVKAIIKVNKNYLNGYIRKYFHQIMKTICNTNYDVVLLISGQSLSFSESMIKELRDSQRNARFILYQWDSEKNFPDIAKMHPYFDECFSFDKNDTEQNENLRFLPLFYTDIYEELGKRKQGEYVYDCSYVGTAHPQKYKYINEMSVALKDVLPNQFIYHYMPSKLKYLYHKVKDKEYKKAKYKEFETKKMPAEAVMDVFEKSRCILDAPQARQTGLTIRTMECLGAKRKLITTNSDIKNYDFYNENNVLVFDGNINPDAPFFKNSYQDIPEKIYQKYSLRNWLKTMLGD